MSSLRAAMSVSWWKRMPNAVGALVVAVGCLAGWTMAKGQSAPAVAAKITSQQAEFGVALKAQGGAFKNVLCTVTVPMDWPGQQRVRVVQEDLPPGVTVSYKTVEDVGRQMVIRVPSLATNQEARAVVTFEIRQKALPPLADDPAKLAAPDPKSLERLVAVHLAPSPKIESDQPEVRKAAEEAVGDRKGAWERVEAIHQWVHANIKFSGGMENVRTCKQTLDSRQGVCAEMNSLAVAMLRAARLPARLVRVPGHCYYEVYLLDSEGTGHWIAGDASASGTITPSGSVTGVILQKGDNVNIVDPNTRRRTKGRFLAETATGMPQTKGAQLQFQPITPALTTPMRTPKANKTRSE